MSADPRLFPTSPAAAGPDRDGDMARRISMLERQRARQQQFGYASAIADQDTTSSWGALDGLGRDQLAVAVPMLSIENSLLTVHFTLEVSPNAAGAGSLEVYIYDPLNRSLPPSPVDYTSPTDFVGSAQGTAWWPMEHDGQPMLTFRVRHTGEVSYNIGEVRLWANAY